MTSPIHVVGQARVFEATVSLKLFNASGSELVSRTTNAAQGGVLSAFSADVPFSVSSNTPACLWVFEASAQDGSPTNVVQIPLTLQAAGLPQTGTGGWAESESLFPTAAGALAVMGAGLAGLWCLARRRARV